MSWAGTGEAYAESYAALCAGTGQRMRELIGAAGERSLIDVGAGDGRLAAMWADAGWRVTACEPEQSMRDAAARRHPDLRQLDGALPSLAIGDVAYDVAVANFVLNHLDDPRAGAAELRRVAGETAVASIWTASPSSFWGDVVVRAGLPAASGGRLPAGRDFERTASGFDRMLREAGWTPELAELTWTWHPTADLLWRSVTGGVAGAGNYYRRLDDGDRIRFRAGFDAVVAECAEGAADDGDVTIPHTQSAAIAIDRR